MAATCPTTETALQAGLLPAQERRKGCFAKASAFQSHACNHACNGGLWIWIGMISAWKSKRACGAHKPLFNLLVGISSIDKRAWGG